MQREAEVARRGRRKREEAIELRNNADNAGLSSRETAQGTRRQAFRRQKSKIEEALHAVKEALKGNDNDAVKEDLR